MEFINVNAIAFTLQGSGKQLNYLRLHICISSAIHILFRRKDMFHL